MEKLGKRWGDQLVIMGFPSREFGAQEYETDVEINAFAQSMNFPGVVMQLGNIKGKAAPTIWRHFQEQTGTKDPTWNFRGKFLVSKDGTVSTTTPGAVEDDISALMDE